MKSLGSIASLLGVLLLHAAVLSLFVSPTQAAPEPRLQPPSVQGILIQAPTPVVPPAATRPEPPRAVPKPLPKPQPKPVSKPVPNPQSAPPRPAPKPAAKAAITPSRPQSSAPVPVPAASAPQPETVLPPRSDASHLNNPAPAYPMMSRRLREQGTVLIELTVLPEGRATDVVLKRSSGYPRLDRAALDAVKRWRFIPARRGSAAIAWRYVQPVSFSLK